MKDNLIEKFKALSGDCRLDLLIELIGNRGPLCVNELVERLQVSQTRVSRNIHILKYAGLVTDRREGIRVFYDINWEDPTCMALVDFLVTVLKNPVRTDKGELKDWTRKQA